MGTACVTIDGAAASAGTGGLVAWQGNRATGRITPFKIDKVGIVVEGSPPLQRHTMRIVAGSAWYAAVSHMPGMFIDCAIGKGGAANHDIRIGMAPETEIIVGPVVIAAGPGSSATRIHVIAGHQYMFIA